jgi:hypothetical protein
MRLDRRVGCVIAAAIALSSTLLAADPPAPVPTAESVPVAAADPTTVRLFLGFEEEPALARRQWWEGYLDWQEGDAYDAALVGGIVAVQTIPRLEIGGRLGFGRGEPHDLEAGRGATDLDVWGKYHLRAIGENGEIAAGGLLTVPTGDDTAGLGFDAFALGGFVSLRQRLNRVAFTAYLGLRLQEDGRFAGADLSGETSVFGGAGVVLPLNGEVALVFEAAGESERFDGTDSDVRGLAGVDWTVSSGGGRVRAAVSAGTSDFAPALRVLGGYAVQF